MVEGLTIQLWCDPDVNNQAEESFQLLLLQNAPIPSQYVTVYLIQRNIIIIYLETVVRMCQNDDCHTIITLSVFGKCSS